MRTRWIAAAALGVALVGGALWVSRSSQPPTFTCSVSARQFCLDTQESIRHEPPGGVFFPELTGGLAAVDVRPAPSAWASSGDPGFQAAQWAAFLVRKDGPPILAACYYSSDRMVFCHTAERPLHPTPSG